MRADLENALRVIRDRSGRHHVTNDDLAALLEPLMRELPKFASRLTDHVGVALSDEKGRLGLRVELGPAARAKFMQAIIEQLLATPAGGTFAGNPKDEGEQL